MREVLIFIGPPGAGKGSLSRKGVDRFGWKQISTGDLCRKHIQEQTDIGKEIDFAIKSGKLISDALVTKMVADWLKVQRDSEILVLDGYPRTVAQAHMLGSLLENEFSSLKLKVIRLVIPDQEVVARLSARRVCFNKSCQAVYSMRATALQPRSGNICDRCGDIVGQRKDDTSHAIQERLKTYYVHEQPLIDFYTSRGYALQELRVDKPLEVVFNGLQQVVGDNDDCN